MEFDQDDQEVNESFVFLYKFASLVRTHAKERNTFRDFPTILDGKKVTENLLNYIHIFNNIDFSNIQENLEIIKIHWESIRNYLPLLLKYSVLFTDREDTSFLESLKNSIVFSVPFIKLCLKVAKYIQTIRYIYILSERKLLGSTKQPIPPND